MGSTLTLTLAEASESDEESEGSSPREGILVGSSSASLPSIHLKWSMTSSSG